MMTRGRKVERSSEKKEREICYLKIRIKTVPSCEKKKKEKRGVTERGEGKKGGPHFQNYEGED